MLRKKRKETAPRHTIPQPKNKELVFSADTGLGPYLRELGQRFQSSMGRTTGRNLQDNVDIALSL